MDRTVAPISMETTSEVKLPPPGSIPEYGKMAQSRFTTPYVTMTQAGHQKNYSCSEWSHRMSGEAVGHAHVEVVTKYSDEAKRKVECSLDVPYGPSADEKVDIFLPAELQKSAPIFVYLHGGYWHLMGREMSSFMARSFLSAGVGVVSVGYGLGKDTSMAERVVQVKRAVKYCLDLAAERGSQGVYVAGHSAGGHLAAMMLYVNWAEDAPEVHEYLKGIFSVSGIFDLRPFVFISDNLDVGLNVESAWQNSPARTADLVPMCNRHLEVLIATGEHDPPEFHRQSTEYTTVLREINMSVTSVDVTNTDHFNVIENLKEPNYVLATKMFEIIKHDQ